MTTEIEMTDTVAGDVDTAETVTARRRVRMDHDHPHYKWVVLSNTTLGTLLATINASIVLISLPAIFRGIGLNPLAPGNVSYLLWMLMGYLVVTAVLVVPFGRLGDMFGRVRIYNVGFVVFTLAAIALSFDPFHLGGGAVWLIGWRVIQGCRRRDADGVIVGDPHRCLPGEPARHGARRQHGRRGRRLLPGSADRWLRCRNGTGRPSSGSACRSASSAPSGASARCRSSASAPRAGSTGRAP